MSRPSRGLKWQSLGAAFILESVSITAVLVWAAAHPPTVSALTPVDIQMEAALIDNSPKPPELAPPIPTPKLKSTPLAQTRVEQAPPAPVPVVQAPSETTAAPPAPSVVASAQPQTKPSDPPAGPVAPSAEYIAKVRAAVQTAFVYPSAAKDLEFNGRTRVAFKLLNTHMSTVRVLVGSGMKIVDAAALQAVQNAVYPSPPNDQKNKEENFEIWVEFRS